MKPLNGNKYHPLSDKAKDFLVTLSMKPVRLHEVNPGMANRLVGGNYAYLEDTPTCLRNGKKSEVTWIVITDKGKEEAERWQRQRK